MRAPQLALLLLFANIAASELCVTVRPAYYRLPQDFDKIPPEIRGKIDEFCHGCLSNATRFTMLNKKEVVTLDPQQNFILVGVVNYIQKNFHNVFLAIPLKDDLQMAITNVDEDFYLKYIKCNPCIRVIPTLNKNWSEDLASRSVRALRAVVGRLTM